MIRNIELYVSILATIITIIGLSYTYYIKDMNSAIYIAIIVSIVAIVPLIWTYTLLILRRVNPKKYIFFSYSKADEELALKIRNDLENGLNNNTKYRYEILVRDDIPLGTNINNGIKELIEKSGIVLLLISKDYLRNEWYKTEFDCLDFEKQRVIPIFYACIGQQQGLPVEITDIKGLYLANNTNLEVGEMVKILSKDIIKNQT